MLNELREIKKQEEDDVTVVLENGIGYDAMRMMQALYTFLFFVN